MPWESHPSPKMQENNNSTQPEKKKTPPFFLPITFGILPFSTVFFAPPVCLGHLICWHFRSQPSRSNWFCPGIVSYLSDSPSVFSRIHGGRRKGVLCPCLSGGPPYSYPEGSFHRLSVFSLALHEKSSAKKRDAVMPKDGTKKRLTSWWLNQPLWKIWVKWESSPIFGVKIKQIGNHHPD